MSSLPSGTVTFLFTDIEGSTKLAQQYPDAMPALLARHHEILRQSVQAQNGYIFQNEGDSLAVAFHSAIDALNTALSAQQLLQNEPWAPAPIKVRMGIHTGTAHLNDSSAPTVYTGYATLASTQRVMSAGHGGQVLLSGATRGLVRDMLPENTELSDMGEKRLKDLLRPEHLYQLNIAGLPTTFPPLKTLDTYPNNLPTQLTTFIGRENEIAEVKQELELHRLVTLTGSGGTGKTRLSLQVAAELLEKFDHGVWFVELAPLTDPDLISQTILSTIGVQEQQGKMPLDVLKEYLHEKQILIVLDNCEHLVSASAQVANTLLSTAPKLKIMASSREALGVKGEASYPVPSLSLPDIKHLPVIEQLSQYEAVRLFIDRALLVAPHFVVDKDNAPHIAQICHRLDGIPLAIELAAARVKILSVEQISKRLDNRFRLLTGGARTSLPRQQTLRALIDWSYNLLSEQERTLLRRLSVFIGGWALEATEEVCAGEGIESTEILDLMSQLVNKSLIAVEMPQVESRYRILETVRQYAHEKLFDTDEASPMREKHLEYFLKLAERAEYEILKANQKAWLQSLDDDFENIRAALEWSQQERIESGLRLGSAIWRFALLKGRTEELIAHMNQLLELSVSTHTSARAKALHSTAFLYIWPYQDMGRARSYAEEGLAISRELKDSPNEAACLHALAIVSNASEAENYLTQSLTLYRALNDDIGISNVLITFGFPYGATNPEKAQAGLEEALALSRMRGDAITTADILESLAVRAMHLRGDFALARMQLEESLTLQRKLDESVDFQTLNFLGILAMWVGDYDSAREYLEAAYIIEERGGWVGAIRWSRVWQGHVELRAGNIEKARLILMDALDQFVRVDNRDGIGFSLEGLASLAVVLNKFDKAVSLFAWVNQIRAEMNNLRTGLEQKSVDHDLATIREHLDESTFNTTYNTGRSMTMTEALQLASEV